MCTEFKCVSRIAWHHSYCQNLETISYWPAGHVVHLRPNPLALSIFF